MDNIRIPLEIKAFEYNLLEAWKRRDYSMLTQSQASDYLKSILKFKASKSGKKRGLKRFFGEAFIAATTPMVDGWYNSYRWLINDNWVFGHNLKSSTEEPMPYKQIFYDVAVIQHIGVENLRTFQAHSKEFEKRTGNYPKAPDLFIIDKENNFVFMEVKLPGDKINAQQEDGLKLIKKYLKVKNDNFVIVAIVELIPA